MVGAPGPDDGDGDDAFCDGDASTLPPVGGAPGCRMASVAPIPLNLQTPIPPILQPTSKTLLTIFSFFPFRSHFAIHKSVHVQMNLEAILSGHPKKKSRRMSPAQ